MPRATVRTDRDKKGPVANGRAQVLLQASGFPTDALHAGSDTQNVMLHPFNVP